MARYAPTPKARRPRLEGRSLDTFRNIIGVDSNYMI
jgi:hypothetical protein